MAETKTTTLYINGILKIGEAGTAPTKEMTNIREQTLSIKKTEADVTHKGGGNTELTIGTLNQIELTIKMLDIAGDPDLALVQGAFISGAPVSITCIDKTSGFGIQSGDFVVLDCSPTGDLKGVLEYNVLFKPTIGAPVVIGKGASS